MLIKPQAWFTFQSQPIFTLSHFWVPRLSSKHLSLTLRVPSHSLKHLLHPYSHLHCHRIPSHHLSSSIGALKDQAPRNTLTWSSWLKWIVKHHKSQLGSTLSAADYLFRIKRVLNTSSVTSGFDMSLNSQVKFKVSWFRACSGCPSYKYHLGH